MNINEKLGDFDVNQLIDRAKIRKCLEIVSNEAKEYIYNQTLEGNFANGGPFSYGAAGGHNKSGNVSFNGSEQCGIWRVS